MNWLAKLESLWVTLRNDAGSHWEIAIGLALVSALGCLLVLLKYPEKRDAMLSTMRILIHCKHCPYVDLSTETCAIGAADGHKCSATNTTSGTSFTITKDE